MNAFQQLLKSSGGHPPIGTWIMSASPLIAEAIGCAGFDWGLIDMEHAPLDVPGVVQMLQAVASTKMLPIVRVPWNDAVVVKRVLDAGATTLLFPMVQNAAEATQAVAATRYPPEGVRGVAGMSRGSRFGTTPHYVKTANPHIGVVVQLESPGALQQLDAIAAVKGVDALFIGPADLSAAMGHVGEPHHPAVLDCMAQAAQRCKALGIPVGTIGDTPELVAQHRAGGFDFVAIGSDLGLMMRGARLALGALRTGGSDHVHLLSSGTQTGT
ncbi:HpcH/HpaI aldolase family protein [Sphaerotilaceae bacterium SBD11-9]